MRASDRLHGAGHMQEERGAGCPQGVPRDPCPLNTAAPEHRALVCRVQGGQRRRPRAGVCRGRRPVPPAASQRWPAFRAPGGRDGAAPLPARTALPAHAWHHAQVWQRARGAGWFRFFFVGEPMSAGRRTGSVQAMGVRCKAAEPWLRTGPGAYAVQAAACAQEMCTRCRELSGPCMLRHAHSSRVAHKQSCPAIAASTDASKPGPSRSGCFEACA
eukprot:362749-Chlamydomonas_euryale.AAC.14